MCIIVGETAAVGPWCPKNSPTLKKQKVSLRHRLFTHLSGDRWSLFSHPLCISHISRARNPSLKEFQTDIVSRVRYADFGEQLLVAEGRWSCGNESKRANPLLVECTQGKATT